MRVRWYLDEISFNDLGDGHLVAVVLPAATTAGIVLGLVDMIARSAAVLLPGRPAFEQMPGFGLAAFVASDRCRG